jgi:hypothetical protein
MRKEWLGLGALVAAGCASVLDIRDPSLEWCLRPGNVHAFCEDFDHPDPLAAWTKAPTPPPGAARSLGPSDDSPPNMLDTRVDALQAGAANLTGLETSFSQPFEHVVVGIDVRVVAANFLVDPSGNVESGIGFLLVEDTSSSAGQPNLCIGLVLAPARAMGTVGVALVLVPNPTDCFTVDNLMTGDAGAGDADASLGAGSPAAPAPIPLTDILTNEWQHVVLDVRRNPTDGSGTVQPSLASAGAIAPVPVGAGLLAEGFPQLGVATSVSGPSGTVEIQFDNITVDFPGQ